MKIQEASLEEIRQRADIVELVREYVPALKAAGRNWKACCPFHQERTPSFLVNPEKQIFHCFGCQAGGDVFAFLMRLESLSFPEAVARLGERVGVRLEAGADLSPQEKERRRLLGLMEFAREFYHRALLDGPSAEPARRYLLGRGLGPASLERFKLGYAPKGRGTFLEAARRRGFELEALLKAGLAARRESGPGEYFWDRVLYPIANAKGEVTGFGARTLGDAQPKYLNSPETPLFSKGRVLYGFYEGLPAVRKARKVLLMEGYMDVVAAHQFGVATACAPLGTALTEDHAAALKRYCDEAVLVFDPDAAGSAAALRGAQLLLQKGLYVRIATMPDGLDPDEVLVRRGLGAFEAAVSGAKDLIEFRLDAALEGRSAPLSPQDKSRLAAELLATLRQCENEVLKAEWLRRIAQRLGVDEQSLRLELKRGEGAARGPKPPRAPAPEEEPAALTAAEEAMLLCLVRMPALAQRGDLIEEADFAHPAARRIYAAVREALGPREEGWAARALAALPPREASLAGALLCDERQEKDPAGTLGLIVGRLRKERRLKEIEPGVLRMGEGESVDPSLQEEYRRLLRELKGGR